MYAVHCTFVGINGSLLLSARACRQ